ncbi:MAG: hypothetical protein IT369_05630, partial [Candidatus Latescibacteria bacterium]|nr:hypothetical protein [Candidatus Latescibacterota bacterium]
LLGIAATSGRAFRQSWVLVFTSPAKVETRDARQVCRYLKVCGVMALTTGVAATLLGMIITLSFMDAPPLVIGEKVGASLVGALIGLFFRGTSYVAEQRVRGRYLMATDEGKGR